HRGRLVVSPDRAAAAARRGEEAGAALLHVGGQYLLCLRIAGMQQRGQALVIEARGQHGTVARNYGDAELLRALLDQQVADARLRRRQQHAGRAVGRVLQALVRTVHADQHLHFVVVGREIVVTDGPVEAQAIARVWLEVVGTIAQRDAAPVVGAAA